MRICWLDCVWMGFFCMGKFYGARIPVRRARVRCEPADRPTGKLRTKPADQIFYPCPCQTSDLYQEPGCLTFSSLWRFASWLVRLWLIRPLSLIDSPPLNTDNSISIDLYYHEIGDLAVISLRCKIVFKNIFKTF